MSLYFALLTVENNKNKKSVKFQGDLLNFCDFIQVFVFTRNHHLKCKGFLYHANSAISSLYSQPTIETGHAALTRQVCLSDIPTYIMVS